jgi:NAD+ synthase
VNLKDGTLESSEPMVFEPAATAQRLQEGIARAVRDLGRRGAVVAVSGGVDSGVVAALCAGALGGRRVLCLRLPEHDLSEGSSDLGLELARKLGAETVEEPISPALQALGYERLEADAIRRVFPDYEPDWRHKLVRSPPSGGMIVFSLVVERPDGEQERRRMPSDAYRALLAATNMKQRVRKLLEYTWADRLHYAVAGTPNLLEYDQGFFVKGGDGLADLKPIAHLYKTQVYQLAEHLGVPGEILRRPPTTDTFSMPQTQDEFYFALPYDRMDLCLYAYDRGLPSAEAAPAARLSPEQMDRVYKDIAAKRRAAAYLHAPPATV